MYLLIFGDKTPQSIVIRDVFTVGLFLFHTRMGREEATCSWNVSPDLGTFRDKFSSVAINSFEGTYSYEFLSSKTEKNREN